MASTSHHLCSVPSDNRNLSDMFYSPSKHYPKFVSASSKLSLDYPFSSECVCKFPNKTFSDKSLKFPDQKKKEGIID